MLEGGECFQNILKTQDDCQIGKQLNRMETYFDWSLVVRPFHDFAHLDVIEIAEQCSFSSKFAFRKVELVHGTCETVCAIGRSEFFQGDPGMIEALIYRNSLVRVHCEHAIDQIERRITNRIPVRRWVVKSTQLDLLRKSVRVFLRPQLVREGREAAETYVEDYTK